MKKSAPVHKGKFLSSRASTKRHAPHSSPTQPVTPVASVANARCLTAKKGDASATIANNSATPGAEPFKQLRSSSKTIASGPESRRPCPSLTVEPESSNSGSGASKTSPSVPLSKPPESTSSGPLRSSTAKTAAFQTRIRPFGLIYTLYTPAEGCSTSSEAGSPLFWSKSGFCPLTLSKHSVSQETGRFELLRNYQY